MARHHHYVGQTIGKSPNRWSAHRGTWSKPFKRDGWRPNGTIGAPFNVPWLWHHTKNTYLRNVYIATFAKQPSFHSPDTYADKWLNKRNAQINIQSTIPPRVNKYLYPFELFIVFFHSVLPTCRPS